MAIAPHPNFRNLAYGIIRTAPTPATTGTVIVLEMGHGARFPPAPFQATVWPVPFMPDPDNAEIVTVTLVAGNTFHIVRAQEGTTARAIEPEDQIAATVTKAYLDVVPLTSDASVHWAGSHVIDGAVTVAGTVFAQSNLRVGADLDVDHDVHVDGDVGIDGGLDVGAVLTVEGILVAKSNEDLIGNLTVGGTATITGTASMGAATINGNATITGSETVVGNLAVGGLVIGAKMRGYAETIQTVAQAGGTLTIDYLAGNHVLVNPHDTAISAITINNVPAGIVAPVLIYFVAVAGGRAVTHAVNGVGVRWAYANAPVMSVSAGQIDRLLYTSWGGPTGIWVGDIMGLKY